jgi:hypothetical protein
MDAVYKPGACGMSADPNAPALVRNDDVLLRSTILLATCSLLVAPGCGTGREAGTAGGRALTTARGTEEQLRPETCPDEWPGPWTACPEAAWVQRVAERAGYRVVDETGSALVAQGEGRSFYIWATAAPESPGRTAEREKWRLLGRREGARVYGDEDLWRWWGAQGFVFWLHAGPFADSRVPDLDELGFLIRASKSLPPPR